MSSKASRISGRAATSRFEWPRDGAGPDVAAEGPVPVHAPAQPPPGPPVPSTASMERDGFASGYTQGERAGFEAGTQRADAMLRRLSATIDELVSFRRTILAQSEREMVLLALAIARLIVRREVSIDQDLVVTIARVALERLGGTATATLRLHPEDYSAVIAAHGEEWAGARVRVVPDDSVSRGGCQIESDIGFVDATIGAQFEQIASELLGGASFGTHDAQFSAPDLS